MSDALMWALKYWWYLCQPVVRACIKVLSGHNRMYRVFLFFWIEVSLLLSLSLPHTAYLHTLYVFSVVVRVSRLFLFELSHVIFTRGNYYTGNMICMPNLCSSRCDVDLSIREQRKRKLQIREVSTMLLVKERGETEIAWQCIDISKKFVIV